MTSPLSRDRINAALTTHAFGRQLVYLPTTGSTNTVARHMAAHGAPEGTVVVAEEQTAGRGRLGRRWLAPPHTCVLCSLLFRPQLPAAQAQRLTMLCALAAADAIEAVTGLGVRLKWPNDLIVESSEPGVRWRKLAGLLTEIEMTGEGLQFAVVGIGVNANVGSETLPSLAPDATSILAETGHPVDRAALLGSFLARTESRYDALRAGESPYDEWAARLATVGRTVRVTAPAGVFAGVAESVDEGGALLLRDAGGTLHRLLAGDVTLS